MILFLDILRVGAWLVFFGVAYLVLYTGYIWILSKICKKDWKEQWKW